MRSKAHRGPFCCAFVRPIVSLLKSMKIKSKKKWKINKGGRGSEKKDKGCGGDGCIYNPYFYLLVQAKWVSRVHGIENFVSEKQNLWGTCIQIRNRTFMWISTYSRCRSSSNTFYTCIGNSIFYPHSSAHKNVNTKMKSFYFFYIHTYSTNMCNCTQYW